MRLAITVAALAAAHTSDDVFWELARTAVGARPADSVVHSRFDGWLETHLDVVVGHSRFDDRLETRLDVAALPRRPIIGLRADKHNASALCAFADPDGGGARLLEKASHVQAYALASLGTAAAGSPFHPQILATLDRTCPHRLAKLLASPKLETWFVAQHWPPAGDLKKATRAHLRKFVQIPLGLHGYTHKDLPGLAPADWSKIVALPSNRTELVASHVSLHSVGRKSGFAALQNALRPSSRKESKDGGHGGFDLDNVFPIVGGGAHATKSNSRSGKLELHPSDFLEYHASLRRAKFVYSPIGSGLDCHRHYEALLFGAIPLIEYEPTLVELLHPFPIVFVRDWRDARAPRLRQLWTKARARAATYDYAELARDVWVRRVVAFREGAVSPAAPREPLVLGD